MLCKRSETSSLRAAAADSWSAFLDTLRVCEGGARYA
jgi:hypothetical protein